VLWSTLPVLGDTEIPWRFLEVMAIPWAVLTALAVRGVVSSAIAARSSAERSGDLATVVLAGGLVVVGVLSALSFNSIARMTPSIEAFRSGDLSGTGLAQIFHARQSFFLPTTGVDPTTLPDQPLVLPRSAGCRASVDTWDQAERLFAVQSDGPCEVALRTYYFPGWKAESGESPLDVRADPQGGGLLVAVPAGASQVRVWFASGWPTAVGAVLSLAALAFCVGLAWRPTVGGRRGTEDRTQPAAS